MVLSFSACDFLHFSVILRGHVLGICVSLLFLLSVVCFWCWYFFSCVFFFCVFFGLLSLFLYNIIVVFRFKIKKRETEEVILPKIMQVVVCHVFLRRPSLSVPISYQFFLFLCDRVVSVLVVHFESCVPDFCSTRRCCLCVCFVLFFVQCFYLVMPVFLVFLFGVLCVWCCGSDCGLMLCVAWFSAPVHSTSSFPCCSFCGYCVIVPACDICAPW